MLTLNIRFPTKYWWHFPPTIQNPTWWCSWWCCRGRAWRTARRSPRTGRRWGRWSCSWLGAGSPSSLGWRSPTERNNNSLPPPSSLSPSTCTPPSVITSHNNKIINILGISELINWYKSLHSWRLSFVTTLLIEFYCTLDFHQHGNILFLF